MPLEIEASKYVGSRCHCLPYYGHGWSWFLPNGASESLGMTWPKPFSFTVDEFISLDGGIVGLAGSDCDIPGNPTLKYMVGCLRFQKNSNLRDGYGDFLLWLAERPLAPSPRPERAIFEWVKLDQPRTLVGYGAIAEEPKWLESLRQRMTDPSGRPEQ